MTTKDTVRAKEQARAQLDSIIDMVKRLEHCQGCNGEDCELTDAEIYAGINLHYTEGDKATEDDRGQYHDEDEARQAIEEGPLSVQVRSDWQSPGEDFKASEYTILLCTGGPAVRMIGELSEHGEPETASLEYQDWFTPWEKLLLNTEEEKACLTYARQFYFGT